MLIILDHCDKKEWTTPLHQIYAEYRAKDSRIGGLSFEDDKDPMHLALQAADLSSMHFRNSARQYVETEGSRLDVTLVDFILSKNQDVQFRDFQKKQSKN